MSASIQRDLGQPGTAVPFEDIADQANLHARGNDLSDKDDGPSEPAASHRRSCQYHWALDTLIDFLPYLVVLASSLWVLRDARSLRITRRTGQGFFTMGPVSWFLSCLLLWAVAFPAYIIMRRRYMRAASAATPPAGLPQEQDLISQLAALADLHSQGVVTDEEFQAKKKVVVREMLEQ
jgi:hypothetical protein